MGPVGIRAWLFITKTDPETSTIGHGYEDLTGLYYSYDSNVAQSRQIQPGDIVLIREDDFAAGWGIVEHIDVIPNQVKRVLRCPRCKRTRVERRKLKKPEFRCSNSVCKLEFSSDDVVLSTETVTSFRAHYANTWIEAARPIHFREIEEIQTSSSTFNAIRPLDPLRIHELLDRLSGRDVEMTTDFPEREIGLLVGGHVEAVVRRRRGQRAFRFEMLTRFGERCAFTGIQPPQVLEAAHIYSFAKRPEHRSDAGLILRRDCHSLFDANLITVNPQSLQIEIAPMLRKYPTYQRLQNAPLQVQEAAMPSLELLNDHFEHSKRVFSHN